MTKLMRQTLKNEEEVNDVDSFLDRADSTINQNRNTTAQKEDQSKTDDDSDLEREESPSQDLLASQKKKEATEEEVKDAKDLTGQPPEEGKVKDQDD